MRAEETTRLRFVGEHLTAAKLQRILAAIAPLLGGESPVVPLPGFDHGAPSGTHRVQHGSTRLEVEIGVHLEGRDWIHTWTMTLTAPQGWARIEWASWFDHPDDVPLEVGGRAGAGAIVHDRVLELFPELESRSTGLFQR